MMDKKLKILHLEDVHSDALLISQAIKKGNFDFKLLIVDTRDKFIKALKEATPDIILADHSLPSFNSNEALAILQKAGLKIPFIVVTATMSDEFAADMILRGADDYIIKDRLHRLPTAIHNALEKFSFEKERQIFLDELIKREKRYHALFESSADGIAILSVEGKPLYVSPSIKNILGYTQEEGMKLDLLSIAHPEDVATLVETLKQAMDNPGVPVKGDAIRIRHKQRGWRWIEGTLTNMLDDPSINGIVDNFRDVTERKQAEQILHDSQEKYRSFFENSIDGILLTEKNGKVLSANRAACDIFKMTEQEIIDAGRPGLVDLQDLRLKSLLKEREKTGRARGEMTFKNKDGNHFPGEISSSVFIDAFGKENSSMIIRDITEQTTANEKLKQSEQFNKGILASLSSHIAVIDKSGTIISVNKAWDDFSKENKGESERVSTGSNYYEVCERSMANGDDLAAKTLAGIKSVFNKEVKTFHLEYPCHSPVQQRWFAAYVSPFGEDDTKVVISHQNITERKLSETDLLESRAEMQTVFNASLDGIIIIDEESKIVKWDAKTEALFGWKEEEVVGTLLSESIIPLKMREAHNKGMKHFLKTGEGPILSKTIEVKALRKDNTEIDISLSISPSRIKNKYQFIGFIRDITERKKAEQSLRESELNLQAIFNNTAEGFILTDITGNVKSFNNKAKEAIWLNTQLKINVGDSIYEFIHPSRKDNYKNVMSKVLGGEVIRYDYSYTRENGEIKWFDFTISPVYSADVIEGLCITSRDITERKHTENSLKRSEFRYRQIVETAQEGIWMIDENSKTTFVNQKMCEIIGYSSDEMLGKTNFFFKDEAGLQIALNKLERRRQGITETYTSSFTTKDGRLIWTQISSNPIFDDAKEYKGSLCMVSDITEKLLADKMLLESEQKYRKLASELEMEKTRLVEAQAIAKVGSWETDLQTLQVNWSEETHRIFGTDPKSFPATHAAFLNFVHPEDRAKVDAAFMDSLGKTTSNSIGHRIVTTEGLKKYVLENWVVFNDENGIPVRAVGTCQDITEKKKLEDLLDKANNLARIGSYEVDLQKNTLYWSDITKQIHEVESDFIPDVETALDFYKAGTSRNLIVSAMKDALENNTPLDLELQIVTAKGNERWVKVIGEAICIDGKCIRLYGSFQDIDKLKNAEIKIRESEFCYRQIVETAQEGVWLIDEHNKTTFVNSKMCEILGYEVNEMMGKEIYDFMDAKGIEIAKDLMKKKKQGHAGHDKFRYISKSGKEVWTKVSANPLFNEDDSYKGALAMVTDITLEMQHEKEIRKNTEERELLIRELTKSLHDLKQFSFITSHNFRAPLSNLVGLLTLLDYSTLSESNREIVKMFETTTNQLNKTINDLIKILIVRNNVNVNITENNISIILNEVCNTLAYNLEEAKCTIHTNLEVEVIAFNQLYLQSILMNLLTNAIKYRSADRQLQINISTTLDASGKVVLIVNDNGVGIDLERHGNNIFGLYQRFHSAEDGEGLGLFIVKSQITAMGGSIHVESEVDKGTSFTITFKDKMLAGIVSNVPVFV